jgi:hypothetical protein
MNDANVVVKEKAPLDELMLAMDVVDTLRHKELVLARELSAEDRDEDLVRRLREIYTSQGIPVTDEILEQGVKALREERFVYEPPPASFSRALAHAYVTRGRWGKWVGGVTVVLAVGLLSFQLFVRGPEQRAIADLPTELQGAFQSIVAATEDRQALNQAQALRSAGEAAVADRDYDAARTAVGELRTLIRRLELAYEIRVVSRPGEQSGVWRVPDENRRARNYYLIVEAIGADGRPVRLPITSEEDGETRDVRAWGLRVDEATFQRVAADKQDDGIIQNDEIGAKRRGELEAQYTVQTSGGAITEW